MTVGDWITANPLWAFIITVTVLLIVVAAVMLAGRPK
jgi:hypothetical protein